MTAPELFPFFLLSPNGDGGIAPSPACIASPGRTLGAVSAPEAPCATDRIAGEALSSPAQGRRPHPSHYFPKAWDGSDDRRCFYCDCRPGVPVSREPCVGNGGCGVSALDLDSIETRAKAATLGPWRHYPGAEPRYRLGFYGHEADPEVGDDGAEPLGIGQTCEGDCYADLEFIAHARTDIPALLAEVRTLRSALADRTTEANLLRAHVAELEAALANERGEGAGPSEGWASTSTSNWSRIAGDRVLTVVRITSCRPSEAWAYDLGDGKHANAYAPTARAAMQAADKALTGGES